MLKSMEIVVSQQEISVLTKVAKETMPFQQEFAI